MKYILEFIINSRLRITCQISAYVDGGPSGGRREGKFVSIFDAKEIYMPFGLELENAYGVYHGG